ncbi:hypothetical protein [Halomarina ordinaria]|uniref:DUF8156 domain-containing protein n=1 Tax=Halomarina ordinaria TaxID=3033939 RepID=A0ABD5UCX8_9EURY|nr:hypothetical protein [Halomarina sp. PSRA2]
MGRTNPTFRDQLRAFEARWQPYRRTLRRRDQPHFDRLIDQAAAHADAAGVVNQRDPYQPILLSIALEQERRLTTLEERIDDVDQPEDDAVQN